MTDSNKKILLSGVKPTGRPHIGNYFGAMKQFVDLQDQYQGYIFIADLHAQCCGSGSAEVNLTVCGWICPNGLLIG